MEQILKITDLFVTYQTERATTYALNGLNLTIHCGESLGLVGESGAGKTTTALSILRLLQAGVGKVTHGEILYRDRSVFSMSKRELMQLRGGEISMIFQNPLTSLNPVFTVGEQIAMVLRKHRNLTSRAADSHAKELLEMVGIPGERARDYPMQFSGGMRQRVGIAAGLACNPKLLIADEPTTALDVTIQAQILELMKNLQREQRTSLMMITHNLGIIAELCDRVAVMYAGRIVEYGAVQEVFQTPMHPYTIGLLGAIPKLEGERGRLMSIPGTIANAQHLPEGCTFHERCERCMSCCKREVPGMQEINKDHFVACFLYRR